MKLRDTALVLALVTAITAYRLPETVVPISYRLHLTLTEAIFSPETDAYTGYVIIVIRTLQVTDQIQIHAAHDFIDITLAHIDDKEFTSISVDSNTDIVTLNVGSDLDANTEYTLYLEFTSRVSTQDMFGFYKSSYTYNDETKYLLTTQFQPVYARRAFPCFDEPALKATFEIYITNPSGLTTLCNMPGEPEDTEDPNLITTRFPPTEIMSSYLIAFAVSEFTYTEGEYIETDAVPYKIWSRAETELTRAFSVDIGPRLLRSLNNFTNFNYGNMGFPKMDQIAIPDFAAGAMENWGLVTYREQYLLWDPEESTNMDQQTIATIISHEFGHMWFGNLVTLQWWSEMFLNEGFATYFEYFTTHDVLPEWELDKQFVVRVLQRVLESDSLETSQALQAPANSDAQVMSRFSQISYLKGGSIFRMVEHVMGTDNFILGLRTYLSTYAHRNTLPEHLWDVLDAQLIGNDRLRLPADTTLTQALENWVIQPGYPIIEVRLVNSAVTIAQEGRFLLNSVNESSRWYVPISYTTNRNPNFENTAVQEWLKPIGFVEIPFLFNPDGWIILNNQATGFYRVNYNNLWDNIAAALQSIDFSGIPEVNRASIVDDAFQLARSNRISYTRLFSIIDFLRTDTSHYAWFPAFNGFNFLLRRVGQDTPLGQAIVNHQIELLRNIYSSVPWPTLTDTNNNHAFSLKQVDVLTAACRLGWRHCVAHSRDRFELLWMFGERPSRNVRSIVYCNGLRYSTNQSDWDVLWDFYQTTEVASEKVRILSALGCTQDEPTLQRYLTLSLDEENGIRSQDALAVFTSVYTESSVGIDIAFKFLQENHHLIAERYQSLNALPNMITGLAERFTTQSQIDELRHFITNGALQEDFHSAASAAVAAAEANQQWLSQSWDELNQYYDLVSTSEVTTPSSSTTSSSTSSSSTPSSSTPSSSTPGSSTPDSSTPDASTPDASTPSTTTPAGAAAIATSVILVVLSVLFALS